MVTLVRSAASRGLAVTRKAQGELDRYGIDIGVVCDLLASTRLDELRAHGPSDRFPEFAEYVCVLRIELEDEPVPFYVKVALPLPAMTSGTLLAFHTWGLG